MPPDQTSEPSPLTGVRLAIAGFALALANFIVVLDITIANVSVPHIAGSLSITPTQGTWVITSYAVAEAISVPLTGWLATRFGSVRLFVGGLLGFGLFSLLCGISPNLQALLTFRVLQGLCGGPIMPISQALMMRVFPRDKANVALGLWGMTTVVAPVLGPILGGHISDQLSWPWIFFINLPIVALCVSVAWYLTKAHETPRQRVPIDYVGFALLLCWVTSLQIMLDKGREEDWFSSTFIVTLAVTASISFCAFVIWELTDRHPIVDLRLLANRGFAVGVAAQGLIFGAFFASFVLLPLFLQTNLGYTATWAGYAGAFVGILGVVMAPVVGRLMGMVDVRILVTFGTLWLGGVGILRSHWTTDTSFYVIALPQLLQGIGMPFFFLGTTALALGAVRPDQTASAAGIFNFFRTLSGAIAVSLATTGWEHSMRTAQAELVGVIHPQEMLQQAARSGLSADQANIQLARMVEVEAVTIATTQVFLVCSVVFALSAFVIWLAPRRSGPVDMSAAH